MKALKLAGPKKLTVEDIDKPLPDGKSVVIRVSSCGICGSDLHYWEYGVGMDGLPGLVMGHEFAGVIEDAGGRDDLQPGDRITAIPVNPCGECSACSQGLLQLCTEFRNRSNIGQNTPGAYAEFTSIRSDMVRKLPDSINDLDAAMIEPSAVSLHAVRTAGIRAGDRLLIIGGGTIGLLSAAWARISGASRILLAEVNRARADAAAKLGDVDEVLDAKDPEMDSKIKEMTNGGVDVAIDASAADRGINSALNALKVRGTLVLAGISFKPQSLSTLVFTLKENTVIGSFAYQIDEFDLAMDFIARKVLDVEKYINRTIGLSEVQVACETLTSGTSGEVKIIIKP